MKKKKTFQGKDWIQWEKTIRSWEKENFCLHSEEWLIEFKEVIDSQTPFFKPGINQGKEVKAYRYVSDWINSWLLNKDHTWHQYQLNKYKRFGYLWDGTKYISIDKLEFDFSKVRYRNPNLHSYKVLQCNHALFEDHQLDEDEILDLDNEYKEDEYLILSKPGKDEDKIKIIHSFDNDFYCLCGCLVVVFDDKRMEWFCPECGLVMPSFTNINEREYYKKPRKNRYDKHSEWMDYVIKKKGSHNRNANQEKNKKDQASILTTDYIKDGLNLKPYQIQEATALIKKLDYKRLYGNSSKIVDEQIKTVCICLYVLEKWGEPKRIGKNKFLKGLGLTNDIYKVIKEKIDSQLSD